MTAGPDDWKNEPFGATVTLSYQDSFTADEFRQIEQGLIPQAMEDKWFCYFKNGNLNFHRSWTGAAVYRVSISEQDQNFLVSSAEIDENMLENQTTEQATKTLDFLISNLLLNKNKPFPMPDTQNSSTKGLYQHHISGTAYKEQQNGTSSPTGKRWWQFWK